MMSIMRQNQREHVKRGETVSRDAQTVRKTQQQIQTCRDLYVCIIIKCISFFQSCSVDVLYIIIMKKENSASLLNSTSFNIVSIV